MQIIGPVNFCLFIIKFVIWSSEISARSHRLQWHHTEVCLARKELIVIASKLNMFSLKITEKKKRKVGECASILWMSTRFFPPFEVFNGLPTPEGGLLLRCGLSTSAQTKCKGEASRSRYSYLKNAVGRWSKNWTRK